MLKGTVKLVCPEILCLYMRKETGKEYFVKSEDGLSRLCLRLGGKVIRNVSPMLPGRQLCEWMRAFMKGYRECGYLLTNELIPNIDEEANHGAMVCCHSVSGFNGHSDSSTHKDDVSQHDWDIIKYALSNYGNMFEGQSSFQLWELADAIEVTCPDPYPWEAEFIKVLREHSTI